MRWTFAWRRSIRFVVPLMGFMTVVVCSALVLFDVSDQMVAKASFDGVAVG